MRITFSKIKLGEFEDLRNFDVFINGNYCLNVVEGDGAYNDWYIQYGSEREIILPELQEYDWQTSTQAKKAITKALKKLGMAEIKKRAKRAHITMSNMKTHSNFKNKFSKSERDVANFINRIEKFKYVESDDEFPALQIDLVFEFDGKKDSVFETDFLEQVLELNEFYRNAQKKTGQDSRFGLFTAIQVDKKIGKFLSNVFEGKKSKLTFSMSFSIHILWITHKHIGKSTSNQLKDFQLSTLTSLFELMERG